jgi:hypothetical protein
VWANKLKVHRGIVAGCRSGKILENSILNWFMIQRIRVFVTQWFPDMNYDCNQKRSKFSKTKGQN